MEPTAIRFGNVINMAVPVDNSLDTARTVAISGIARIESGRLYTLENGLVHELPDPDRRAGCHSPLATAPAARLVRPQQWAARCGSSPTAPTMP